MTIRNAANNNVKPTIFGKICGFEKFFRNLVTFRVLVRNRVHGDSPHRDHPKAGGQDSPASASVMLMPVKIKLHIHAENI